MSNNNAQTIAQNPRGRNGTPETTRGALCFTPPVDIFETEGELLLYADLPGVDPKEIDLRYERGELTLTAKAARPERHGQLLAAEFEQGDFYRLFRVNETIDPNRIEADYKQGVLIVHLPKQEKARPKQVLVRTQ
jgi:HSP20 family protein